MRSAEEQVLIGGNHLATQLLVHGADPALIRQSTYHEVLWAHGSLVADMWVAWKAIMDWRDTQNIELT